MNNIKSRNGCSAIALHPSGGRGGKYLLAALPAATAATVAATATAAALRLEPNRSALVDRNGLGGEGELLFTCHS